MHQRSALLLVLLRSLTWKLLISPTFLFSTHDTKCYSLMADWCKIDGERKGCEAKNEGTNQQTFQTQSRFASQIRFHRRSFENGKIVIFFFQSKLSISSFGSSVMYAHQDAWKFFLKPITRENNGCSCNQGCYKWIDVMSSDLWGHILIKLVCGSNWAKIRTDCAASCKRKSF